MKAYTMLTMLLLALGASHLHAQPSRDQAKKVVPPIGKNALDPMRRVQPFTENPKIPEPFLSITSFEALRSLDLRNASITAQVRNDNLKPVTNAQYFFEQWTGSTWKKVGKGLVSVKARGSATVHMDWAVTMKPQQFRVQFPKSLEGVKSVRMYGHAYTVAFRCPDWQMYGMTIGRAGDSAETVKARAKSGYGAHLLSMGFEVKYTTVRNTEGGNYNVTTSYRAPTWVTRQFDELPEAQTFLRQLPEKGVERGSIQSRTY